MNRHNAPENHPDVTGRAGAGLLAAAGAVCAWASSADGASSGRIIAVVMLVLALGALVMPWGRTRWFARAWIPVVSVAAVVLTVHDLGMRSAGYVAAIIVAACAYAGVTFPTGASIGLAMVAGAAAALAIPAVYGSALVAALTGAIVGEGVAFARTPSRLARERAQRRASLLSAVAESSRRLHERDRAGVVNGLLEGVRRLGFPGVALVSYDRELPLELGDAVPDFEGTVERVRLRARPVVEPHGTRESGRPHGAVVGVPVWLEGGYRAALIAVALPGLEVAHSDIEALELLADLAGRALENARATEADRRRAAELFDVAHRDELTGLGNRRHGVEVLEGVVEGDVIALIDVDGLKQANDTHGHAMGDQILAGLGDFLRQQVRSPDEVARIGGDEFLIVLRRAADTAPGVLERLRDGWFWRGQGTTLSIGMAVHVPTRTSADTMRTADEALYEAKRGGRNQVRRAASKVS
ncbi:MAG: diguanylate cyclase domain-containing protein [Acidimicrobiia bacterium]